MHLSAEVQDDCSGKTAGNQKAVRPKQELKTKEKNALVPNGKLKHADE
jgi:hypothetical protein